MHIMHACAYLKTMQEMFRILNLHTQTFVKVVHELQLEIIDETLQTICRELKLHNTINIIVTVTITVIINHITVPIRKAHCTTKLIC